MYCKKCGAFFIAKRHFHELFLQKPIYFCQECLKSFTLEVSQENLPLDNGKELIVYHLYKQLPINLLDYLALEYSRIISYILKEADVVLLADSFTYLELPKYNQLAILCKSNLYLIVFT